ncbi:response regulator transcription factor [Roseibacterium sp. SDUM158016]|uniref:response regulator transcription factor n=1 Tax=Roseicyclus sediminis TaxID=2980997 RepID=UPI0021D37B34|nr:response regulator transcription factor [Roseibacterium sp. SDUM158016]MCU4654332.1 response regulator transcription factor [Roseibacterium sp. SDUM158016]
MQVYVHEPRKNRIASLLAELRSDKIVPSPIDDAFFERDLSLLNRPDSLGNALLLAAVPGVNERITALREAGCENPVVVMRDFRNAQDTALLLDRGADEVVVMPIKAVELRARVNAILRRSHGHSADEVKVGEIVAYFDGRDPEVAGHRLRLSQREHAIFKQLALNATKVVPKSAIYDAVYGIADVPPFEKVIDVYICKIRKKLEATTPQGSRYIETVPGRGYRFSDDAIAKPGGV